MSFNGLFSTAVGKGSPYPYQRRLAEEPWPDLLNVPTGLGKTAAVTMAWLYKRGWREGGRIEAADDETPRRLVWCLPMRVLVEQTDENLQDWLSRLGLLGKAGEGKVSVQVLMGGGDDLKSWAEYPEEDMILIGTQDMLLSRALMRGYGMSRYQWPVHFALLHNDCLWVFDEVQLMGAGLATSAQLEAFRRRFPLARRSRSLWVSATLNRDWLGTIDLRPHLASLRTLELDAQDQEQAGPRVAAVKALGQLDLVLDEGAGNRAGLDAYLDGLAERVLARHDPMAQTLVVLNQVGRAQGLFCRLKKQRPDRADLLIHSRFRAHERAQLSRALREQEASDRILVATQAIEAGVDLSAKVLITELAPWPSMVQRFGRCNRYGEHNQAQDAEILWIDIADDGDGKPYESTALARSRDRLTDLDSASPQHLPPSDEAAPARAVLRRKDLLDLFNTDPDLSGFDVDVSDYVRDTGMPGLQVFWRDFADDPNSPEVQSGPVRLQLCPISMGQAKDLEKRDAWYWDSLGDRKRTGRWVRLDRRPRPGMVLLLRCADGGYDPALGFDGALKRPVEALAPEEHEKERAFADDQRSLGKRPVALATHLGNCANQADALCRLLAESDYRGSVVRAGRWHDVGKAHEVFDQTMHRCETAPPGLLAKSPCKGRHSRRFFRHELASMLAWLEQHNGEPDADLIAYLILAHHGKVRMSLRAMPTEEPAPNGRRFARGIWEGDALPALDFDGERSEAIELRLALMELGEGEQGSSWTARVLGLLDENGPFRLAWLETLVRIADWRASAQEQEPS